MILDDRLFLRLFNFHENFNLVTILNCILVLGNLSENEDFQFKLLNNKAQHMQFPLILINIKAQVKKFKNMKMTCQILRILANFSVNPVYHYMLVKMDIFDWVFKEYSHRHCFTSNETFSHLMTVLSNLSSAEYFHKVYLERYPDSPP